MVVDVDPEAALDNILFEDPAFETCVTSQGTMTGDVIYLSCPDAGITSAKQLGYLYNLRSVDFDGNPITKDVFDHLAFLPELEAIRVERTGISCTFIDYWKGKYPDILVFSDCPDPVPAEE